MAMTMTQAAPSSLTSWVISSTCVCASNAATLLPQLTLRVVPALDAQVSKRLNMVGGLDTNREEVGATAPTAAVELDKSRIEEKQMSGSSFKTGSPTLAKIGEEENAEDFNVDDGLDGMVAVRRKSEENSMRQATIHAAVSATSGTTVVQKM